MNFTSKQRSYLKGLASTEDAIFQIGKSSITPSLVQAIDDAIEKRELIKISVLKNCMDDPHELADIIAGRTHSNVSSKQEKSQNYTSEIGGGFYEKSRHYGGHIQPDP